jgi:hypothetical protein
MERLFPNDVVVALNGMRADFTVSKKQVGTGDEVSLSWNIRGAVSRKLNGISVPKDSVQTVKLEESTTFELIITDPKGNVDTLTHSVDVVDPLNINRALDKLSTASQSDAHLAVDGNMETEWIPTVKKGDFIEIDLGKAYDLQTINLNWGDNKSANYEVNGSNDRAMQMLLNYEKVESISVDSVKIRTESEIWNEFRYLRIDFLNEIPEPIALKEIQVFGAISSFQPPQITITRPVDGEKIEGLTDYLVRFEVTPGSETILKHELIVNGELSDSKLTNTQFTFKPVEGNVHFYVKTWTESRYFYSNSVSVEFIKAPEKRRFEAESAILTGETSILSNVTGASGGRFVNMNNTGKISWPFIFIRTAGNYRIKFGYYLPFDVKSQYVNVNGSLLTELEFETPITTWLETEELEVQFVAGNNSVEIEKSWGYMYFDYLDVIGDGQTTVSTDEITEEVYEFKLLPNYPNPFNPSTTLAFSLGKSSFVELSVFDVNGRRVSQQLKKQLPAGLHRSEFNAHHLASGVYIVQLKTDSFMSYSTILLIK